MRTRRDQLVDEVAELVENLGEKLPQYVDDLDDRFQRTIQRKAQEFNDYLSALKAQVINARRLRAQAQRRHLDIAPVVPTRHPMYHPQFLPIVEVYETVLELPSWVMEVRHADEADEVDEADDVSTSGIEAATRLKTCTYDNVQNGAEAGQFCVICTDLFQPQTIVRVLPCKHFFCDNCVLRWFINQTSCPVCRHDINQQNN